MSPHDPHNDKQGIRQRKVDHIDLCTREDVEQRLTTTLLEEVTLLHRSLPELAVEEIDLGADLWGRRLKAPLCVSGMTGGAEAAQRINLELAKVAQRFGLAFGVGSQRAMLIDPALRDTYAVREVAPDILLLGNIGLVQAAQTPVDKVRELVRAIEADALCVHLNPAQEMIQAGGDRDFRGGVETFKRLVGELGIPIIAKETGCGIAPQTARQLAEAGVSWVDVSGAGGTTWVGVEALRAKPGRREVGEDYWEWGVPTAASVLFARREGLQVIASGGLRNSYECARALALGASLCSMALPFLRAVQESPEAAEAFATRLIDGLQVAMTLTGSRTLADLQRAPRLHGPNLRRWEELE